MRVGYPTAARHEFRKQALPFGEGGRYRKRNNRTGSARIPRTDIRTVRRRSQARDRAIHPGIEDSVAQYQQESLQGSVGNLRILDWNRPGSVAANDWPHLLPEPGAVLCLTSYLFSAFAASFSDVSLDRSNFGYGEDNSRV